MGIERADDITIMSKRTLWWFVFPQKLHIPQKIIGNCYPVYSPGSSKLKKPQLVTWYFLFKRIFLLWNPHSEERGLNCARNPTILRRIMYMRTLITIILKSLLLDKIKYILSVFQPLKTEYGICHETKSVKKLRSEYNLQLCICHHFYSYCKYDKEIDILSLTSFIRAQKSIFK